MAAVFFEAADLFAVAAGDARVDFLAAGLAGDFAAAEVLLLAVVFLEVAGDEAFFAAGFLAVAVLPLALGFFAGVDLLVAIMLSILIEVSVQFSPEFSF